MKEGIEIKNCYELFKIAMKANMNSCDILVRFLALDNYFGKNDFGFNFYNEVQHKRVSQKKIIPRKQYNNISTFKKLIKNILENGFDKQFPLCVNKNSLVIDGSHRLAICLYLEIKEVPVIFKKEFENIDFDYSLKWFEINGFESYSDELKKQYDRIIKMYEVKNA